MYVWGLSIDSVSIINLVLAVGLAVDYAAHTAHMFKEAVGDSKQRAREALGRIGPSVFNAIISTLLAVIIIGFSKSYVFVIFFRALALVTVVAGMHGMWLLPAMLALIGGDNLIISPNKTADSSANKLGETQPDTSVKGGGRKVSPRAPDGV